MNTIRPESITHRDDTLAPDNDDQGEYHEEYDLGDEADEIQKTDQSTQGSELQCHSKHEAKFPVARKRGDLFIKDAYSKRQCLVTPESYV
ncbi:hypothetical protein K505DRAFT_368321 [Melanomma pulvis-pyrius CBS 109.77]|uniref:Uncharacterized protein n=1 Tax=Melanomma pulvis-pyrius CBS 109.77 TaxID=1314802 RepID=A0A6A6WR13_9PLEO|nr:hypothetical protein K505DRAFT_368321 [Melanomma pulvis-pyrius CBS 109.77]